MNKLSNISVTFLMVVFCLLISQSASYADPDALTIDDAMKIAVATHPTILAKKSELAAAGFAVDVNKWLRFPALSVSTNAGQRGQGVTTTLIIDQPIWAWGKISSQIDASKARELAAEASLMDVQQAVLVKVVTAYCQMVLYKEKIAVSDASISQYEKLYQLMTRRAAAEISPKSELLLSKSRLESARSERFQLLTQYENSKADLEQLIGEKFEGISYPKVNLELQNPMDQEIQKLLEFSPQLKQYQAQILASDADLETRKSVYLPQLSARYEQFWGGNYPPNTLFLALTFQPGNGLSALSTVRQAEATKNTSESNLEASKKEIVDKLRMDFNQVVSSSNTAQIYEEYSKSTIGVYESYLRQFTAGRKTWMEVMNAYKEVTQSKYSLIESWWNGTLSNYKIDIATGRISPIGLGIY